MTGTTVVLALAVAGLLGLMLLAVALCRAAAIGDRQAHPAPAAQERAARAAVRPRTGHVDPLGGDAVVALMHHGLHADEAVARVNARRPA